jgi:D-alanine-D-alanine ligase
MAGKYIGILVGGPGHEAPVSLRSASFAFENFPRGQAEPFFIAVNERLCFNVFMDYDFVVTDRDNIAWFKPDLPFFPLWQFSNVLQKNNIEIADVAGILPLMHGQGGEDGLLPAFFQSLGIRCAGFDYRSSLVAYDKVLTKLLLQKAGLEVVPFRYFMAGETVENPFPETDVFVKPAREGSSFGVSPVTNPAEFKAAVALAFSYDSKIIVEKRIRGRELECAVIETKSGWRASSVGEIKAEQGFYSFSEKYSADSQSKAILADLSDFYSNLVQQQSLKAVQLLEGRGFARVDFFLADDQTLYINEINSLPGFTAISMFPALLKASGFSSRQLTEEIIAPLLG